MTDIMLTPAEAIEEIRNMRPIADASCILSAHSLLTLPNGMTKALCHCFTHNGTTSDREYILESCSFMYYFKPQEDFSSMQELEEYLEGGGIAITPHNHKVWYQMHYTHTGIRYYTQKSSRTKSKPLALKDYWSYRKYDNSVDKFLDFINNLEEFKDASR